MTRADVLAYAQTLEFIPPCLHWGTCQACGVTVWWATWPGSAQPTAFMHHDCTDGLRGRVVYSGECQLAEAERAGSECRPTHGLIGDFGPCFIIGDGDRVQTATVRITSGSILLNGDPRYLQEYVEGLVWLGPAEPYDPAALSEAMRRDREP